MDKGNHPKVIRTWTVEGTRARHQQNQPARKGRPKQPNASGRGSRSRPKR